MTNDVLSRPETSSRASSAPQSSVAFDVARERYNQAETTLARTQAAITEQNRIIYGAVSAEHRTAAMEEKIRLRGQEKDQDRTVKELTEEMQRLAPPEEVNPPSMEVYMYIHAWLTLQSARSGR